MRAISAGKPDISIFLVKSRKKKYITQWSLEITLLVFNRSNNRKTFPTGEIYNLYFAFQKNGLLAAMQIKNFQNPLDDAFENAFS